MPAPSGAAARGASLALTAGPPSGVPVRGEASGRRGAAWSDLFRGTLTVRLPQQPFQAPHFPRAGAAVA